MCAYQRPRQPDEIFCPNCGSLIKREFRFCTRCGAPVPALPGAPAAGLAPPPPGSYPVRFDVAYPERLSRLLIFVKLILAVPQLLIVYALSIVSGVVTFIAWFAILFTKRYPKGMFELVVGFNRWSANVYAYIALLRDEYPPFSTDAGRYPIVYEVDYPERLNRWLIFVKWLLVIPHQFVINLLGLIAFLFYALSWFAILFTGRYPRTFFNFIVGLMRWSFRVGAYSGLMRDEFPPYSKRADARPGSGTAVAVSAVAGVVLFAGYVAVFLAFAFPLISFTQTEEVLVPYEDVLAGDATAPVNIEGTEVVLLRGEDPFDFSDTGRRPRSGRRFVMFELRITNVDSIFTSIADTGFRLKDSSDDGHAPVFVGSLAFGQSNLLDEGEAATVQAVFEIEDGTHPASLTYAPGFAAFIPFGEKVKFIFE